jgi:hypothetical protein
MASASFDHRGERIARWDSVTGTSAAASAANSWLPPANRDARWPAIAAVVGSMAAAVLAAGLILHRAATQRDAIEEQAAMVARSAAAILDDELATARAVVDGSSASRGLRSCDFDVFRQQMTAASQPEDSWLILLDGDGNPLLCSSVAASVLVPTFIGGGAAERVAASGRASVSSLIRAATGHGHAIALSVPVLENGRLAYVLLLAVESGAIGRALDDLTLRQDWAGITSDRDAASSPGATAGRKDAIVSVWTFRAACRADRPASSRGTGRAAS